MIYEIENEYFERFYENFNINDKPFNRLMNVNKNLFDHKHQNFFYNIVLTKTLYQSSKLHSNPIYNFLQKLYFQI